MRLSRKPIVGYRERTVGALIQGIEFLFQVTSGDRWYTGTIAPDAEQIARKYAAQNEGIVQIEDDIPIQMIFSFDVPGTDGQATLERAEGETDQDVAERILAHRGYMATFLIPERKAFIGRNFGHKKPRFVASSADPAETFLTWFKGLEWSQKDTIGRQFFADVGEIVLAEEKARNGASADTVLADIVLGHDIQEQKEEPTIKTEPLAPFADPLVSYGTPEQIEAARKIVMASQVKKIQGVRLALSRADKTLPVPSDEIAQLLLNEKEKSNG